MLIVHSDLLGYKSNQFKGQPTCLVKYVLGVQLEWEKGGVQMRFMTRFNGFKMLLMAGLTIISLSRFRSQSESCSKSCGAGSEISTYNADACAGFPTYYHCYVTLVY
jgi:hypothetical protein